MFPTFTREARKVLFLIEHLYTGASYTDVASPKTDWEARARVAQWCVEAARQFLRSRRVGAARMRGLWQSANGRISGTLNHSSFRATPPASYVYYA